MMRHAVVAAALLANLVAGCSSPPSRFYTLNATAATTSDTSRIGIAVGPVIIPATIDRPQIVLSTSPNQVALDEFSRWASPVDDNIARVTAENLTALLGTPRVVLFPQTLNADIDYRVQIDVRSLESAPGSYAAIDAVWTVRRGRDGKTETGRTRMRETLTDSSFDALAAAHSRSLARMAQDIAAAIRTLDKQSG